jgi:hypothetical protein
LILVAVAASAGMHDAAAQSRPPTALPAAQSSPDILLVLDRERRAQDLRRAVGVADALTRQIATFANSLPNAESLRNEIRSVRTDITEGTELAQKIDTNRQSFIDAESIFRWRFPLPDPLLRNTAFSFKLRLQRIQEQFSQTVLVNISDTTLAARFNTALSELVLALDEARLPRAREQFDRKTADLDKKLEQANEALFGAEIASQVRNSPLNIFLDEAKFVLPGKDRIDQFRRTVAEIVIEYEKALTELENTSEYLSAYDDLRKKFSEVGPALASRLREELKSASDLEGSIDRSRQFISGWLFVGLSIAFVLVISILLFAPKFYDPEIQHLVFRSPLFLQLFTVYVLSSSIVILALGSFLESQTLATLLAGISGYVLGQLGRDSFRYHADRPEASPKRRPRRQRPGRRPARSRPAPPAGV